MATKPPRAPLTLPPEASWGCGAQPGEEGREAVGVGAKERNGKRLRRIEGQVRGVQKMVDEDRYCADVLTQISAVQEAPGAVSRELMRNHLKHCATTAIRATPEQADAVYDEIAELMHKHSRRCPARRAHLSRARRPAPMVVASPPALCRTGQPSPAGLQRFSRGALWRWVGQFLGLFRAATCVIRGRELRRRRPVPLWKPASCQ